MADRDQYPSHGIQWTELVALTLTCLAEAAIVWTFGSAIVTVVTNGASTLPFWAPFSLLLVATLIPRLAEIVESPRLSYEWIVAAGVILSLVFAVKTMTGANTSWRSGTWLRESLDSLVFKPADVEIPVWIVVVLVATAWWRGRGRAEPNLDASFQLFKYGIPLVLAGATLLAFIQGGPSDESAARASLLFVVSSLVLIAFMRLTGLGSQRTQRITPMDVAIAAVPLLVIGLLGLLVIATVSGDLLATILHALSPVLWLLRLLAEFVLLIIIVIVYIIVAPIFWLIGRGRLDFSAVQLRVNMVDQNPSATQQTAATHQIPDAIRYVIALAVLALIFAGVNRYVLRNWRRRPPEPDDTERETVRPMFDLNALLAGLLGSLRRKHDDDPLAGLRGDPAWAATVRIREQYAQFLEWCRELGHARRADRTPGQHRSNMQRDLTGAAAAGDLEIITERYERARYDQRPASESDAAAVDAAWQRLKAGQRGAS